MRKAYVLVITCEMLLVMLSVLVFPSNALEIERPDWDVRIQRAVANATVEDKAVLGLGVFVDRYYEPDPYNSSINCLRLNFSASANTRRTIEYEYENVSSSSLLGPRYPWMYENWSQIVSKQVFNSSNISHGTWVQLGQYMLFRFYGGLYEGIEKNCSVWVSTQGFLSFDLSQSNASCAGSLPDVSPPNAVIAPLWTNLTMDSSSRIVVMVTNDNGQFSRYYFVVIWENMVHIPDGHHLTFAVGLKGHIPGEETDPSFRGDSILMDYREVAPINTAFMFGIEDQEGRRGAGDLMPQGSSWLNDAKGYTLNFAQSTSNVILRELSFDIIDSAAFNGQTLYRFLAGEEPLPNMFKGMNIASVGGSSNTLLEYLTPIADFVGVIDASVAAVKTAGEAAACGILSSTGVGAVITFGLLMWDAYTLASDLTHDYTVLQQSGVQLEYMKDSLHSLGYPFNLTASVGVETAHDGVLDASFDAALALSMLPMSDYTTRHNVTVRANAMYQEYDGGWGDENWIRTEVTINIGPDDNGTFDTADQVIRGFYGVDPMLYLTAVSLHDHFDFYKLDLKQYYNVSIYLIPPLGAGADLYVFYPNETQKYESVGGGGDIRSVGPFVPDVEGNWYIKCTGEGEGYYNMSIVINVIGDIRIDDKVDILDAILLSNAFGSQSGGPRWNSTCDLNNDSHVNILDAIILSTNFDKSIKSGSYQGSRMGESAIGQKMMLDAGSGIVVNPNQLTAYVGETFVMNVTVTNVNDLCGWEFKLYWNSTLLNCTDAAIQTPAEWQDNAQNYGSGLENVYNATHGRFWAAQSANYPASSFNGSMTIATLTFHALQPGTTSLALMETQLGNSIADPIDHTESSGSVDVSNTRYMRGDTQTVNNLNAYLLNATETSTLQSDYRQTSGSYPSYWGIRAWMRSPNGTEVEIQLSNHTGTPQAVIVDYYSATMELSATTVVTSKTWVANASLVVRVYFSWDNSSWTNIVTFTTERLAVALLKSTAWTVYYDVYHYYNFRVNKSFGYFYWGTSSRPSRVENLQFS